MIFRAVAAVWSDIRAIVCPNHRAQPHDKVSARPMMTLTEDFDSAVLMSFCADDREQGALH
jgi:hypothetical protein